MILITSLLIIVWVQNTEHWSKHMERIMSKKNIIYYDCIDDKSILEKDNWTIRKWTIENDKIMLGYEKTNYGIGSLKNMLDSIPSSDTYQIISKISDIVSTAKNLGIIDDD